MDIRYTPTFLINRTLALVSRIMIRLVFVSIILFCAFSVLGQVAGKQISVTNINSSISVDGILDEQAWLNASPAKEFMQYFPADSVLADQDTEISMVYDDDNLYIGIVCHSIGDDYIVPSLKRDFRAGGNDNITLLIDPFNDGINAFMFGINPMGVLREGLISGGGVNLQGFTTSWDQKWTGEAQIYDDKWTAEIVIPFSVLRYNADQTIWRFNSYRFDMQSNERTTWVQIPRNQWIFNLGYMGTMNFDAAPKDQGSNISLIPYTISSASKDYEEATPTDYKANFGGDAKVAITTGLNLDVTANPDFSQVEVDRQVTNLDRFEIFFPERRQFFLENADLFGAFGFSDINPFFSRRIGIAQDTATGTTIQNTIYGGARLSGKINEDWRIGVLSMQTAEDELNGQPSQNFTVAAAQRRIGARSNIGILSVNRQSVGGDQENSEIDNSNRVVGIDYNLATANNKWTGKTFIHRAITQTKDRNPYSHGFRLDYTDRDWGARWQHEYVGEGYDAQVGFVRRQNYFKIDPRLTLFAYPSFELFNRIEYQVRLTQLWRPNFGTTDQRLVFNANVDLLNNSRFNVNFNRQFVYLFDPFDPTGTDQEQLAGETEYVYYFLQGSYNSDRSKVFSYRLNPYIGEYFNGKRYGLRGNINYRFQPFGQITLNYGFNIFDMPYLNTKPKTYLIGPTLDLTFSKSVFFTTFVQYNSQVENTNINMRFQWRFAPVSDFFLVFSDNYFTGTEDISERFNINVRNRSIVAKVTYWFNI